MPIHHLQAQAKLQCLHCNALMSASNPSRTQATHIERGGCPVYKRKVEAHRKSVAGVPLQNVSLTDTSARYFRLIPEAVLVTVKRREVREVLQYRRIL
jgi:hypothetical protein